MNLYLISLTLQILSACSLPFIGKGRKGSAAAHLILLAGLLLGFANTLAALIHPESSFTSVCMIGIPQEMFRFDALGLFFLAIIQLIAIPATIYSYSYLNHYIDENKSVKSALVFYISLLVSTQVLVAANHAILFLICWELMSTTAYLGMIFEKEKPEVQTGSFYYLIISHVAMYFLFIFFILLKHQTGSWLFSDFHIPPESGIFIPLYILALIAFGIKAGFMPFHFWLPQAHPIAPSVLSAFLSGVIIKMGIYGILRTFQFLNPAPLWLGWTVILISMVTAIFGVWYALAQHDIKRLLAYHSVENIGIIGIGIGLGFIGSSYHSVPIQILGFGGALLHTLNHAIFKSLLFIGSGIICQNLGTRNIEKMGGIVHFSGIFMLIFLTGSAAICGIPPLNGFISEFILFNGFFTAAKTLKSSYPLLMLILTVGLAFVGGLAVACFTKINAIMFLGNPRKEIMHFHVSLPDYLSLGILSLLCIVIGFFPQPFISLVNGVLTNGFVTMDQPSPLKEIRWQYISFVFIILTVCAAVLFLIKRYHQKKNGRRRSAAWGCGYEDQTARMQYTASSYADELNQISRSVLLYSEEEKGSRKIFPTQGSLESHSYDFIDSRILIPGFKAVRSFLSRPDFFASTDLRYYISFILIIITVYSVMAFLWV